MRKRTRSAALAAVAALAAAMLLAAPAFAHEDRKAGPFVISFGLNGEPVVNGEQTFFDVDIAQGKPLADGGRPVVFTEAELEGLALHIFAGTPDPKNLKAVVNDQPTADGKPRVLGIHAATWEGPGVYYTDAIRFPQPGAHTAHFHSQIEGVAGATKTVPIRGQVIDQVFPMGEGKYGPIDSTKAIDFPKAEPTNADLVAKDAAIDAQVAELTDQADQSRSIALGLAIVAALALIVGTLALVRGRRRDRVPDSPAELTKAGRP